jgi:hypothetical protein
MANTKGRAVDWDNHEMSVPGGLADFQLEQFISRRAKQREEELGESADRARAQAEFEHMEEQALARAEQEMEKNIVGMRRWMEHLSQLYYDRHCECQQVLEELAKRGP